MLHFSIWRAVLERGRQKQMHAVQKNLSHCYRATQTWLPFIWWKAELNENNCCPFSFLNHDAAFWTELAIKSWWWTGHPWLWGHLNQDIARTFFQRFLLMFTQGVISFTPLVNGTTPSMMFEGKESVVTSTLWLVIRHMKSLTIKYCTPVWYKWTPMPTCLKYLPKKVMTRSSLLWCPQRAQLQENEE